MSRILSIQSHVAFGHVGNAAITLPLQLLGHEVWPVPTAVLSNHAGYPETGGALLSAETVHEVLAGVQVRIADTPADLVLTGYLGSSAVGEVVQDTLGQLHAANSRMIYCCDPVMGDRDSGLYVAGGLTDYFRDRAVPAADLLTPNHFELGVLAEAKLAGAPTDDSVAAARRLLGRMRPGGCVLITSFEGPGMSQNHVAMVVVTAEEAWVIETPRFDFTRTPHGTGDLAAALFAAHYIKTRDPRLSLEDMSARLHAVLEETAKQDSAELELVLARETLMSPGKLFEARVCV